VGRIALHRVDEIWDQIGSALELDRDVAPGLIDADTQLHERVVSGPEIDADGNDQYDDHSDDDEHRNENIHGQRPPCRRGFASS